MKLGQNTQSRKVPSREKVLEVLVGDLVEGCMLVSEVLEVLSEYRTRLADMPNTAANTCSSIVSPTSKHTYTCQVQVLAISSPWALAFVLSFSLAHFISG